MKKNQLEKARKAFATGVNTEQLRARVSRDLEPIKDAYDIAYQALQKIEQLIHSVDTEDKPIRAMRDLASAMRDAAGVLTAMRDEGRASVRFAAERQAPTPSAHTPTLSAPTEPPALPATEPED